MAQRWVDKAQKHSRCKWVEEVLPLDTLKLYRIDEQPNGYQRPLNEDFIARCLEEFDAAECRTIYVSRRDDDSLWVLDGQHTREMLIRSGITDWVCRVFVGLTPAEEAWRFQKYQTNAQRMSTVVQYNAEVIAGVEEAVIVERVLEPRFLRVASKSIRMADGYLALQIKDSLIQTVRIGGEDLLGAVLDLLTDSWGVAQSTYGSRIVRGVTHLLAYTDRPFERQRLVDSFRNTTIKTIQQSVDREMGSGGAGPRISEKLIDLYRLGVPGSWPRIKSNSRDLPRLLSPSKAVPHNYFTE